MYAVNCVAATLGEAIDMKRAKSDTLRTARSPLSTTR